MLKRKHGEVTAVVLACAIVASLTVPSSAQQPFLERVRKYYQLDKSNGQCNLCHDIKPKEEPSRKNLGSYGKAIADDPEAKPLLGKDGEFKFTTADLDLVQKIAIKLEQKDNDGDGVFNKEELDLGSLPGDAKSVPEKLALTRYRKANPPKNAPAATAVPPAKKK